MNWLQRWLERRRLLKVVSWDTCAWSPKKAAEKRFTQRLVEHYQQIARIQLDAMQTQLLMQMRQAEIIRMTAKASAERARAEYQRHYEIHRARGAQ